jgi:hypothetical protein
MSYQRLQAVSNALSAFENDSDSNVEKSIKAAMQQLGQLEDHCMSLAKTLANAQDAVLSLIEAITEKKPTVFDGSSLFA